jgi:plasmid stability protein
MATITIRKIDDGVKAELRIRAALHGHSMEEEAREVLTAAMKQKPQKTESVFRSIRRHLAEADLKGVDLELYMREPVREPPDFGGPEYGK